MVNYQISMTRQLLSNRTSRAPGTKKEQKKENADHPVKTKTDNDNDKDEERGRSIHRQVRHDHIQSQQVTNTSTSSRSRSRSASIPRQSSRRPQREAAVSISPIRAVYNHAERGDAYRNDDCRHTSMAETRPRSGRSSVRISPGTWYDRSPHLRYGLAHETRTKRSKSPDWDDDEDEDVIVQRMVKRRGKKLTKKDGRLVRYWVGRDQGGRGGAMESAEEVLAWDAFEEARGARIGG
ncbi:hypothetical protein LTR70_009470 [Exophiala xenobiotica]|uniref:Uncharacterized protein n=1 Tax=Lithohypha guttulata TaxID=1690604 RepID=A0ABR0JX70_9EURO|nr:hypothetical protein LTR24_009366 [Lithohypha guttulata]KAK5310446.1 hypothetical protein LTR70_009470 [Exophiala xenobiotica]